MSACGSDGGGQAARMGRPSDLGSSTPEIVVILPVLMLLVTFGLQFALWALASQAISDAVVQGAAALRAESGTATAARAVVSRELDSLAFGLVLQPDGLGRFPARRYGFAFRLWLRAISHTRCPPQRLRDVSRA